MPKKFSLPSPTTANPRPNPPAEILPPLTLHQTLMLGWHLCKMIRLQDQLDRQIAALRSKHE
jgi:hypothetical protein